MKKIFIAFVTFILLLILASQGVFPVDSTLFIKSNAINNFANSSKHDLFKGLERKKVSRVIKKSKLKTKNINSKRLSSSTINLSISALSNTTFCSGDSVELITRYTLGMYYQWYSSQGGKVCSNTLIAGATSSSYFAKVSGYYFLTVIDQSGNSITSNIINVTVNPSPQVNILTNGPLTFCEGSSVVLTVSTSAGNSFLWSNGVPRQSILVDTTGTYYAEVTNLKNGCKTISKTVVISVYTLRTDINKDGITDYADYLLLIQKYNNSCANCTEDIDQDGKIKNEDFLKLLGDYNLYCY